MTFDRNRHLPFEELISAAVSGDITLDEQQRLDAHLATCAACRATADAFAAQRRIMSGLRHVPPPRDLGARLRTLVELEERRMVPWWRRPPAIVAGVSSGLAVVAGALLAIVVLNEPSDPQVGRPSLTPRPSASSASSQAPATTAPSQPVGVPTLPPPATPLPSGAPTPAPTVAPDPTPIPSIAPPEPDGYVAVVGPVESAALSIIDGTTEDTEPVPDPVDSDASLGVPVDAELAPGGEWIAFAALQEGLGTTDLRVTRSDALATDEDLGTAEPDPEVPVGETIALDDSITGNPFGDRLVWSPDGRFLAATITEPETGTTDVWIFDTTDSSLERLTDVSSAYAASFAPPADDAPTDAPARLWVSVAGDTPRSYLVELPSEDAIAAIDPAQATDVVLDGFLPLVSPNGSFVIFWEGTMRQGETGWEIAEGGQPMLSAFEAGGERIDVNQVRPLFSDLPIERDGITAASIVWGPNGDAYAVWDVAYTGTVALDDPYPDANRVYFGHASDPRGLTRWHAIDIGDIPPETDVVDVKVGPSGRHLLVTARYPRGGVLEAPRADLILVERNTGDVADVAQVLNEGEPPGWYGPAVFDEAAWRSLLGD